MLPSVCRDTLSIEVDDLRDQHKILSEDLSSAQVRWHIAREEKVKASSILERFKKSEEELVLLAEEKEQLTIEKKVLPVTFYMQYRYRLTTRFFVQVYLLSSYCCNMIKLRYLFVIFASILL